MNNPIIQRQLIGTLRSTPAFVLQLALATSLAGLVLLRWPTQGLVDLTGQQAQEVFRVFGYGLLTVMILLAPIFPATTIVAEKKGGTLALLLNSPMSRWSILFGKFTGVLGFVLLLLVLSIPAAVACYTMGGIDLWEQLVMGYVVLTLVAVQYAALGLLVSSYAATAESAVRTTYALILLLAVGTMAPMQFFGSLPWFQAMTGGLGTPIADWLRCLSPIEAMKEVLGHASVGSKGMMTDADVAGRFIFLSIIVSAAFLIWTGMRLDHKLFDKARDSGKMTESRTKGERAYRRIMFLYDPQRRRGLMGSWTNPVMIKEFRTRKYGRAHWVLRFASICLLGSLGLMLLTAWSTIDWGTQTFGTILVLLQMGIVVLFTPTLASGVISTERESGGWALLQMTPLRTYTIIVGKLLSVLFTLFLLLLATLPGYAVMLYIDETQQARVINVLITLGLTSIFALLLSAAVSSCFKRTAAATTTAYTLMVGLCAGTMLFWLNLDAPFSFATVQQVLLVNPVAAALQQINATGFGQFDLVPFNWYFLIGGSLFSLIVLAFQTWRLTRPQ